MTKDKKLHFPILGDGPWGLRPLCRYEMYGAIYALNVSETTCKQCLIRIARAQNLVQKMRRVIMGGWA